MGYNVVDILDKSIKIANKRKIIFENIEKKNCDIPSMKILSKVLIKEVDRTVKYYEKLKEEVGNIEFEEIDFVVYDKISFLINEFNKRIYTPDIHNVREYLRFSIDLEKDNLSLLVDIQGRFVKRTSDIHTKTYEILSKLIDNIDKHIITLEKILK